MSKPLVLIVDDEPDLLELVTMTLGRMQIDTRAAADLGAAKRLLTSTRFNLCLTDMRLPDGDGLELVSYIQDRHSNLPVAVITAHGNVELAVRALKLGAFDFVSKPLDLAVLRKLVLSAIKLAGASSPQAEQAAPESKANDLLASGQRLIGESAPMRQLRELVARVARSQAPVYISGESGTGKELVARLIHDSGPRSSGPFVPVNCGAIPGELMESELFGHKKGSFTGAVADKKGLVQAAEGGTLFLDEVADLPLHMQVKLLRVIQEKAVRPVGESLEQPVDVRILSATHKKLADLVAQGKFREDLFYRINVIELRVPALRERGDDIASLVAAVVPKLAARAGLETPRVTPAALELLRSYAFPGNVRELENILERAVTLSANGAIDVDDIELRRSTQSEVSCTDITSGAAGDSLPVDQPLRAAAGLPRQLEDAERAAIVKALEQTRYNKTAAAKLLGMSFRALRYRTKKLGID
jgi:two-component system response regulator PilR (NtrC family)